MRGFGKWVILVLAYAWPWQVVTGQSPGAFLDQPLTVRPRGQVEVIYPFQTDGVWRTIVMPGEILEVMEVEDRIVWVQRGGERIAVPTTHVRPVTRNWSRPNVRSLNPAEGRGRQETHFEMMEREEGERQRQMDRNMFPSWNRAPWERWSPGESDLQGVSENRTLTRFELIARSQPRHRGELELLERMVSEGELHPDVLPFPRGVEPASSRLRTAEGQTAREILPRSREAEEKSQAADAEGRDLLIKLLGRVSPGWQETGVPSGLRCAFAEVDDRVSLAMAKAIPKVAAPGMTFVRDARGPNADAPGRGKGFHETLLDVYFSHVGWFEPRRDVHEELAQRISFEVEDFRFLHALRRAGVFVAEEKVRAAVLGSPPGDVKGSAFWRRQVLAYAMEPASPYDRQRLLEDLCQIEELRFGETGDLPGFSLLPDAALYGSLRALRFLVNAPQASTLIQVRLQGDELWVERLEKEVPQPTDLDALVRVVVLDWCERFFEGVAGKWKEDQRSEAVAWLQKRSDKPHFIPRQGLRNLGIFSWKPNREVVLSELLHVRPVEADLKWGRRLGQVLGAPVLRRDAVSGKEVVDEELNAVFWESLAQPVLRDGGARLILWSQMGWELPFDVGMVGPEHAHLVASYYRFERRFREPKLADFFPNGKRLIGPARELAVKHPIR